MGVHHDNDGVGDGLDYIQLQFTNKLRPGSCFQVVTIDNICTVSLSILVIFVILHCQMEENFKDRPEQAHHLNLDGTNASDLQLYISMSDINFN